MIAAPEISRIVSEFEESSETDISGPEKSKHHEQRPAFQSQFTEDVHKLVQTLEEMGNLFLEDCGELIALDTKDVASDHVVNTVKAFRQVGKKQFTEFMDTRIFNPENKPITNTMTKNKLPMFSNQGCQKKLMQKLLFLT